MEMLLAAGADVNVQDDDGGTPLVHALLTGETEAAGILIAAGAQRADLMAYTRRATHLPSSARGLLHRALSARTGKSGSHIGDLGWARLLLDSGADPDERNDSGQTPLHLAADWQMSEFVSLLIDRGAEVDARDMGRTTPLLYAASGSDPNLVRLLLDHGADVNAHDVDGDTPLHNAARGGHAEVLRLLLVHGADTAVWNSRGRTPLDEAVRSGDKEVIRLLTEADQGRTGASSGDFGEGR
jgi:ankyrin repeat protein